MRPRFNTHEILEMAVEIECNGEKFYRKAAELNSNAAVRKYLLELAEMEVDHVRTFSEMRDALRESDAPSEFDPYDEGALYLDAIADAKGGEGAPALLDSLTPGMTTEDILLMAVEMEKKAVLFYLGLRSMVPSESDLEQVDRIIREEKSHIVTLTARLRDVRKSGA